MIIRPVLAAVDVPKADISKLYNPAPNITGNTLSSLISGGGFNLVTFAFAVIGLVFMTSFIKAGFDYLSSSGDPTKINAASSRMTNSLIGIVVVFSSFILVNLILNMIGLESIF